MRTWKKSSEKMETHKAVLLVGDSMTSELTAFNALSRRVDK